MGRYYHTDNGAEGKFMFGVQPSDDPAEMGMHEQDPQVINYYADEDDVPTITKKLDEQYDKLGVPKEQRIYSYDKYEEAIKFEEDVLTDRVFIHVKADDTEARKKYGNITWCSSKGNDYVDYEKEGMAICLARVRLALDILSDIKKTGYCSLEAEL